jgi:hypothetical protein
LFQEHPNRESQVLFHFPHLGSTASSGVIPGAKG